MLTVEERFWPKVERGRPYECWEWLAYKTTKGHGQFAIDASHQGKIVPAHRVAFELIVCPLPAWAVELHHVCENPSCVNPAHLVPMTVKQHRQAHAPTHCPQGHPYDEANTYVNPNSGNRLCRECKRIDARRWWRERGRAQYDERGGRH